MHMKRSEPSYSKIPWLLLSRLSIFVLLLIIMVLFVQVPDFLVLPFTIYSFTTLALLLFIAFDLKQTHQLLFSAIVILQLILEIAVETGVVYHTGGMNSPFAILFVLTVLSASILYQLIGSAVVAVLASLAYASLLWFDQGLEFSFKSLLLINESENRDVVLLSQRLPKVGHTSNN